MKMMAKLAQVVSDIIAPKFFNQVAQIAHVSTMYAINLTLALPLLWFHHWIWDIVVVLLCAVYASWHEFIYDPRNENDATRGSDLEDFGFLMLGVLVGQGMAWLLVYVLR
jgi:hypothetical protein